MFFDDDDIIEFITSKMPEYYETFCNLSGKIQQIDFFRYLAVYYYGGLYLDLDVDTCMSFSNLYAHGICTFPVEQKGINDTLILSQDLDILIGNYAFYAPPQHPFIKRIIENIVRPRIAESDIKLAQLTCTDDVRDVYVYYRTGPILVTQTFIDYQQACPDHNIQLIEPIPYKENCFGDYGYHFSFGTWRHVHSNQKPL